MKCSYTLTTIWISTADIPVSIQASITVCVNVRVNICFAKAHPSRRVAYHSIRHPRHKTTTIYNLVWVKKHITLAWSHTNAGFCQEHGIVPIEASSTIFTHYPFSIVITDTLAFINGSIVYTLVSMAVTLTHYRFLNNICNSQLSITYVGKHWHCHWCLAHTQRCYIAAHTSHSCCQQYDVDNHSQQIP